MLLKFATWKKIRWALLFTSLLVLFLLVFASNRFLYLSHQRFPVLSALQWNHKANPELRTRSPVIIGHRGSELPSLNLKAPPEDRMIGNTRRSIAAAIEADVAWIEIDLRISRDQQLVVFHDAEIDLKCTEKGAVAEMTLEALQTCDILVEPSEKILSLPEVFLEFQAAQHHWILDIKAPGISATLITQIEASKIPKEQIIIFGDHDILQEYIGTGYRLGYTTLYSKHQRMIFSPAEVFQSCKDHAYDLLVVPIFFVTPRLVSEARDRDLEIWSYDSNDPRDLQYCADCGVTGLIVDTPKAAKSQFRD